MNEIPENLYNTESHGNEIDLIFQHPSEEADSTNIRNNIALTIKSYLHLLGSKFSGITNKGNDNNFTNVLYLTFDCPGFTYDSCRNDNPQEYITELKKQYPNYDIRILIPLINVGEQFLCESHPNLEINGRSKYLEKTAISLEFFLQNKKQKVILYKFPKDESNIQVYGIYSKMFSQVKNIAELNKLHYLAPFVKAVRGVVKAFGKEHYSPHIIHADNVPYYLGAEFEGKKSGTVKVLQVIKDFTRLEMSKTEPFWTMINLADKTTLGKICRDNQIKNNIINLYTLHNKQQFCNIDKCLNFVYKNYYKFRKYIDKGEDIEENIIFRDLNTRVIRLFPDIFNDEDSYCNPMYTSLPRSDYWVVNSHTYYKEIFNKPNLSGKLFKQIEGTKEKSGVISYGCNLSKYARDNEGGIYQNFSNENFRDFRWKNKNKLIKEFSYDRIKTNFVDPTLFKTQDVQIFGALDSFYEAPLLFANMDSDTFANGIDILFNTLAKLFELNKNIQIIINIKNGMKVNFIRSWVKFLSSNSNFDGRWVYIDGDINLKKFYAAADMVLIPQRTNITSINHFLAMYYGCIPIAARTGILNDTIPDIFDDILHGCGLKTGTSLLTEDDGNAIFLTPVIKALNLYKNNPASWNLLIKNCLNHNSNWTFEILENYHNIYQKTLQLFLK